ncbi:MAG: SIMPL domain-containing protein [Pseudomonadota bacterium]
MRPLPFFALAFLMAFSAPAFADPKIENGKLTLTGIGEAKIAPDQAVITLSVVTQRRNAAEALNDNSKDMTQALNAIKAEKIDAKDIQTSNVSIQPQYAYLQNSVRKLTGYEARNSITVVIKDLTKVGIVLDKAVTLGVNEVNGPYFGLQDNEKAQNDARLEAMENVRKLAALYEQGMGIKTGKIIQISENYSAPEPQPVAVARMAMMEAKSAPAPVEAGEMSINARVSVVWEILP